MACRTVLRSVLIEAWQPLPGKITSFSVPPHKVSTPSKRRGCKTPKTRNFCIGRRTHHLSCSNNGNPSSSSSDDQDQGPPQEAVLKAISEVSKAEGRVGQTTNVVIGGTVTDDSANEWLALDKKVNSYPTVRGFTAIGTGGSGKAETIL